MNVYCIQAVKKKKKKKNDAQKEQVKSDLENIAFSI